MELEQSRSVECKDFLEMVATGKIKAVTTDFILDSIGVVMEEKGAPPDDIRRFFSSLILFKELLIYNLGLAGRANAADEMETEKLGFDDSTSVATLKVLGIKEIVSFDHHFDRVNGITRAEPRILLEKNRNRRNLDD